MRVTVTMQGRRALVRLTGEGGERVILRTAAADGSPAEIEGPLAAAAGEWALELEGITEPERAASLRPKPDAAPTWAEVARASASKEAAALEAEAALGEAPLPRPGDRITHPTFGVCAVQKLETDEDFVLVRSAQNRILRLSLDVLRLELVGEVDGRREYRAAARGGRK